MLIIGVVLASHIAGSIGSNFDRGDDIIQKDGSVTEINNMQGPVYKKMMDLADTYEKPAFIIGFVVIAFGSLAGISKWKLICDSCGAYINAA